MVFDVSKYTQSDISEVDMAATKKNVGVFLSAYQVARMRIGYSREPKVTASYSLTPPTKTNQVSSDTENVVIENIEAEKEFIELHEIFELGYVSIQHPFKSEIGERRKKIFYDRYINGYTIYVTAQRNFVSEETVKQESSMAIVQFASALRVIVLKGE